MEQAGDFDIAALYESLDAERQARGMTWQQAARDISRQFADAPGRAISASTLTGLRGRDRVEGDGVLQMLRWLGRTPESFMAGAGTEAPLPDAGPRQLLRFDATRVYAALDARRAERGITWRDVAGELPGFTAASLTRLARGGRMAFPHVGRIARWLGAPVASFVRAASR